MQPLTRQAVRYIAIAFAWSWLAWLAAIELGWGEWFLNVGVAGPAVAAILLVRGGSDCRDTRAARRGMSWLVWWFVSWAALTLHYAWRSDETPRLHASLALLVPALVPAIVLSRLLFDDEGVRALRRRLVHRPDRWTAFAILFFVVMLGVPSALASAVGAPLMWPTPHRTPVAAAGAAVAFLAFNFLFVGVLEEPGWRGFLLDRLQHRVSPLMASLLVWLPWAAWHAPLDYFRPGPFSWTNYILLRVVFLIPLTVTLTWLYNRSDRSLQATATFHAMMNTFPFVVPYYQPAWLLVFAFAAYAVVAGRMGRRLPADMAVAAAGGPAAGAEQPCLPLQAARE